MTAKLSSCRTCAAPIIWTRTEQGRAMPVDAAPLLVGGNVELLPSESQGGDPIARVHGEPPPGSARYVSHFATCPDRDLHRKLRPDGKRR